MTTPIFDANFEGLLREAASAKDSLLLRVDRAQILPALRSREAPASVAMAGLSKVERELLASYRCELGFLLRQAALNSLRENSETGPWIDSSVTDDRRHEQVPRTAWEAAVSQSLAERPPREDSAVRDGSEFLGRLLAGQVSGVSTPQFAAASLRLEPRDEPRVYTAAHLAATGTTAQSIAVVRACLDGTGGTSNHAYALEVAALAQARAGRFQLAAQSIERACALGLPRSEPPIRWLFYSCQAADLSAAQKAIQFIQEGGAPDVRAANSACEDLRAQIRCGAWVITAGAREMIRTLDIGSDPLTGRLFHALIS
jgi:hypothetical protein